VLSPSAKRPHKNLPRLLRAVAAIPAERRPVLVVPGYPTPHETELRELAGELGIVEQVRLPAWLSEVDLEGLYRAAACVVFPSLYEGFGLPVLEAMARGVPVACSSRSSLPEVAGDAALLFDPEDVDAIRSATERLLTDAELADGLRAAGRERAAGFTWERTAELTVASYRRALESA
jgi:glycosyltransferase involved in cell wall biosynthesis